MWLQLKFELILTYTKAAMNNQNFIPPFFYFQLGGHLGWTSGSPDTILKGTHLGTIPARFGLIWFSGFSGEDLNVKVYDGRQVMGVLIPYQERLWAVLAFSHPITHKPFEKSCIWTVFNKRFILWYCAMLCIICITNLVA